MRSVKARLLLVLLSLVCLIWYTRMYVSIWVKRRNILLKTSTDLMATTGDALNVTLNKEPENYNIQASRNISEFINIDEFRTNIDRDMKYNWSKSGELGKMHPQFAPGFNAKEYTFYLDLIRKFKYHCEQNNITYMLAAGTILGAYRYHGFVPWDDDFDVFVNASQKDVVKKTFESVPGLKLLTSKKWIWKLWAVNNSRKTGYKWNWPFIDILFFEVNRTHFYDFTFFRPIDVTPKGAMLPLQKQLFEGTVFPVPCDMFAYLSRKYPKIRDPCLSNHWNHRNEKGPSFRKKSISCDLLFAAYPLVHRYQTNGTSYEELRLGKKTLYKIRRPNLCLTE